MKNKATSLKSAIPAASSRVLRRFLPSAPVVAVKEVALKLLALIPRGKPRGFSLRNYKKVVIKLFLTMLMLFTPLSICAETPIIFGSNQHISVTQPGFFPFSNNANNDFIDLFPTNPNPGIDLTIMNFIGSPCKIAPAENFEEIGPQITVDANGNLVINFNFMGAPMNTDLFGFSFVPQAGSSCEFDFLPKFPGPPPTSTSSTSGVITVPGGGGDDTFTITPNSISIFGGPVSNDLFNQITNEPNNPQCQNSPTGINRTGVNDILVDRIYQDFVKEVSRALPEQITQNTKALTSKEETNAFTLVIPEGEDKAKAVYNQKLVNTTDMTKIYATILLPTFTESGNISARITEPDIEVSLKAQTGADLIALAAVQHAIISATMPWQLSKPNGFFIVQGGGCVGPFCTIVEAGMVVIDPNGACTPEKLSRRKAGYPTVNPSMFFDKFPVASKTIQIPTSSIVDPSSPLISKAAMDIDNAYLILQPVPPGGRFVQQLKLNLKEEKR